MSAHRTVSAVGPVSDSQHYAEHGRSLTAFKRRTAGRGLKKVNLLLLGGRGLLERGNIVELWALAVDSSGSAYFTLLPLFCACLLSLLSFSFFSCRGTKN